MSERDAILGRLRSTSITTKPALPDVAGWYAPRQRHEDQTQRVARLRAALEAAHTKVHDTNNTDWPALLVRLAAAIGVRKLLIGASTAHGAALKSSELQNMQLVQYTQPIEEWRDALFDGMDASLTLARSAIAETGSLVLWPSASEPRTMSLVPPVHFEFELAACSIRKTCSTRVSSSTTTPWPT